MAAIPGPKGGTWATQFIGLAAGNCADNQQRLAARSYFFGQRGIHRFVRKIFFAREEAQKRTPLAGAVIANRPAQHGEAGFECIQHRAHGHRTCQLQRDFALDARQVAQMIGQQNADCYAIGMKPRCDVLSRRSAKCAKRMGHPHWQ